MSGITLLVWDCSECLNWFYSGAPASAEYPAALGIRPGLLDGSLCTAALFIYFCKGLLIAWCLPVWVVCCGLSTWNHLIGSLLSAKMLPVFLVHHPGLKWNYLIEIFRDQKLTLNRAGINRTLFRIALCLKTCVSIVKKYNLFILPLAKTHTQPLSLTVSKHGLLFKRKISVPSFFFFLFCWQDFTLAQAGFKPTWFSCLSLLKAVTLGVKNHTQLT